MAVITVNFPTDEEEELLRRFTVNRHYLQSIAGSLTGTYGHREQLYSGLKATLYSIRPTPASTAPARTWARSAGS